MIKTMSATDIEFQELISDLESAGHGQLKLFDHDDVQYFGLGHHVRVKSARGVLREIQRAQHLGKYIVTVEVMGDGIDVMAYTALAHV